LTRKSLAFAFFAAIILIGVVSLYQATQRQSARVELMRALKVQLNSMDVGKNTTPCRPQALAKTWQAMRARSTEIEPKFAFVLADLRAKSALDSLQGTLKQTANCRAMPMLWRELDASCKQCHQAVRGKTLN
jgi:hypothetical protein